MWKTSLPTSARPSASKGSAACQSGGRSRPVYRRTRLMPAAFPPKRPACKRFDTRVSNFLQAGRSFLPAPPGKSPAPRPFPATCRLKIPVAPPYMSKAGRFFNGSSGRPECGKGKKGTGHASAHPQGVLPNRNPFFLYGIRKFSCESLFSFFALLSGQHHGSCRPGKLRREHAAYA